MLRSLASFLIVLIATVIYAQNCQISSDSIVCKGEIMSFNVSHFGTGQSYLWKFGDGKSATQKAVTHSYSQLGSKIVTIEVTLSDGTTCTATKKIFVHDFPKPAFSFDKANFCLSTHEICLVDNSNMGATTNGYDTRVILWGDGAINNSNNPSLGNKICYSDFDSTGKYTIAIEVKNDKGCEAKWNKDIEILKDYQPDFKYSKNIPGCKQQQVCFVNKDKGPKSTAIEKFVWDFGDGSKDSTVWDSLCYYFKSTGTFNVTLTTTLKNGCTNTKVIPITINFPLVKTDVTQWDSVSCYPQPFLFSNPVVPGANYFWEILDTNGKYLQGGGFNLVQPVRPPYPGDFKVRLIIKRGLCTDTSENFDISSLGVRASFIILNDKQCGSQDTAYFINKSVAHWSADPHYFWDFKDSVAAKCSTWKFNCNFDTATNPRHLYNDTGCFFPKLWAYDSVTGCRDSFTDRITLVVPQGANFTHKVNLPCIGPKSDYKVNFDHKLCDADIRATYDSCYGAWTKFTTAYNYDSVCNPEGWVSVGFAVATGDSIVYRSHDINDYYVDPGKLCHDTTFFHNWFQLHPDVDSEFEFFRDTCLPDPVTIKYIGEDPSDIELITYSWSASSGEKSIELENPDTLPDLHYIYTEEGKYTSMVRIQDTNGCFGIYSHFEEYGYFNDLLVDSIICPGTEVEFHDTIRYYDDDVDYWGLKFYPETVYWDFGEGNGVTDSSGKPKHTFGSKGIFRVMMATKDRKGCTDTLYKDIFVGGVNAGIKFDTRTLLCDQITQFLDSSYSDFADLGDTIKYHFWNFGDNTSPSYKKNPYHSFSSNRIYTITHGVTNEKGCTDTTQIIVELIGPKPYFEFISDSVGCVPFKASFKSNSTFVSDFIWSFGDNNGNTESYKTDTTVSFIYNKPGIYYVYLEGADSFYNSTVNNYYSCSSVYPDSAVPQPILKRVIVLPIPPVDFDFQNPVCKDQLVSFYNQSDTIYDQFQWVIDQQWINKDTSITEYTFADTGSFDVTLIPTYVPQGLYQRACYDTLSKLVKVTDVKAGFTIIPDPLCSEFSFNDSSFNAVSYQWDFGHPTSGPENFSTEMNPSHDYGIDSGNYEVCLIVLNEDGCLDTACQEVEASYSEKAILYNVFTPGSDGTNDDFGMDVINPEDFDLRIYNRWGELVFKSIDPAVHWNGKVFNIGDELPASIYMYVLKYKFYCTDELYEAEGIVDLIRE